MLLHAPVPELQSLRLSGSGNTLWVSATLTAAAGETALHLLPFRSNQFEISATFNLPAVTSSSTTTSAQHRQTMSIPAGVGLRIMACPALCPEV